MTQNEFKKFREDILKGFQLSSQPTIKSILALVFSGLISTYGIYSILLSLGVEGNTLYQAIGLFIIILIVADTFKRGSLVKYYNSQLRNVITGAKVLNMQLVVSILALAFMVVFDIVGSFSTANYVEKKYQEFQATNSKEFELLQTNAKNGQTELSLYSQELSTWQQDKEDAKTTCNEKWNGWKAKYKAKCKEEWNENNPKPIKPSSTGSVSVEDYKDVKKGVNDGFLSEYLFYIILFLATALTMLLQYTTISQIQDKKDEVDQSLTDMVIGILQDRLKELETNMIQHETKRNELISHSDKEEKKLGRDFEKRGKAIGLLSLSKAVDARGDTVQRIANNTYVPHEESKAGFVVNPFNVNESSHNEPRSVKSENQPLDKNSTDVILKNLAHGYDYIVISETPYQALSRPNGIIEDVYIKEGELNSNITYPPFDIEYNAYMGEVFLAKLNNELDFIKVLKEVNNGKTLRLTNNYDLYATYRVWHKQQTPNNSDRFFNAFRTRITKPLNESVITDRKESDSLNGAVKRMDLKNYSPDDLELIDLLWKQATVKRNDQLETRDNVLKVIGDNKNNTLRLRNLYKKLLEDNYIYKRVGYFSNVEV